jgi:hypothetical protein
VRESSGVVASRTHEGVFWTHNHSGNSPTLYAIGQDGRPLGAFRLGISSKDWEDVANDDQGHPYVGEIGDNDAKRPFIAVHQFAEPDPANPGGRITPLKTWRLRFPDRPVDCESLFIHASHGYLISKVVDGQPAGVYRFPLDAPAEVVLEKVTDLPIHRPVTSADLSADGERLAVLSRSGLHLFTVDGDVAQAAHTPPEIVALPKGKLEGVCFTPTGLLLTAESREIYRIDP